MFKKSTSFRDGVETLVSSNTIFTGSIDSEGSVRVDGKVNGNIKANGDIYIGNQAVIKGNVESSNVHLAGTIEGNIVAGGILKILSSAKLYGDIKVNSFVADEGALFQGKCEMMESSPVSKNGEKAKKNYKKSNVIEEIYEEKK